MTGVRGVTLVELLVSLAVLSLIAAVAGLSFTPTRQSPIAPWATKLATARREALRTGQPVSVTDSTSDTLHLGTAFPDGRTLLGTVVLNAR